MLKHERWRLVLVVLVAVAAVLAVFPLEGRLRLGLDLKGGAHIVLQAKGTQENPLEKDSMMRLLAVLRNRIDQYGVTEPVIQQVGDDRVAIDLPGVADPEAALDLIGRTAQLSFRAVEDMSPEIPPGPVRKNYDTEELFETAKRRWEAAKNDIEKVSKQMELKAIGNSKLTVARDESGRAYLLGPVYVGGKDLKDAGITYDQFNRPVVSLKFNAEGSKLFEKATGENIKRQIAIVLDDMVISAPVVQERIAGGQAQISGRFDEAEAQRLAIMLRAGALPVAVEVLENRSVGPTLGADSIKQGIRSGLVGAALMVVFMLVYYGMLGIAADMALAVSMLMVMAGMVLLKATLTLPGIGGIILTIGMAVDGNILIYERMKEEQRAGRPVLTALNAGFRKALVVILDSNITTLIAAAVLFYFGTGPIRGFAVTLSIGVISAVFCNVVVTRAILQLMLSRKRKAAIR